MGVIVKEKNDLIKGRVTLDQFYDAFDWEVKKQELYIDAGQGGPGPDQKVNGFFATVRENTDGTRIPLGVVKSKYEVIGNKRILETVEELIGVGAGEPYDFQVHNSGARFAYRLLFPKFLSPNLNDKSNFLQLCLSVKGSHDGSSGLVVELSPILRYCLNGLLSLGGAYALQSVRHSSGADLKLDKIRQVFGRVEEEFGLFGEQLETLSRTPITPNRLTAYVKRVIDCTETDVEKISTRTLNVIGDIEKLAREGRGNAGRTLWDAYQGVTEYVDHYRGKDAVRGWNAVAGTGADLKRRALQVAVEEFVEVR